jgi:hypothetical membrane protein
MNLPHRNKIGPILWACCFQYFLAEAICAHGYAGYSLSGNFISDLGVVHCRPDLCSPLHAVMNASFMLQGLLIFFGALLIRPLFRSNLGTNTGFFLLPISGLGVFAVGIFPKDTLGDAHYFAAAAHFAGGGLAMLLLGISLLQRKRTRNVGASSVATGTITLVSSFLLTQNVYLGLGPGGMERIAGYIYIVWLVGMGIGLLLGERPKQRRDAH